MAEKKEKILLKRSSVPGRMPSEITGGTVNLGELFLNIASGDADNFLTTLRAEGSSAVTSDYIKWSDDVANEKKFATKEEVMDNELVVSTIITKINKSVGLDENGDSVLPNGESLSEAIIALQNNSVGAPMTTITYSELKTLRDESKLIPGMQYRIIDYITTTSQENTSSAGHQFDVIVTALDNKTLSEEASACLHDGDTYFSSANAKLEVWKLWYCLDNDTDRFAWADTVSGKGVIYRMIDEGRNDLPYDFKNIMFRRYKLNAPESVDSDPVLAKMSEIIQAQFSAGTLSYIWGGLFTDEDRYWESRYYELFSTRTGEYMDFYTFSDVISGVVSDISLNIFRCYDNVMGRISALSNNVFFSGEDGPQFILNSFGDECYDNSFGDNCSLNSFGDACESNSFGDNCCDNLFGSDCNDNSFGLNGVENSFGVGCRLNSFGVYCTNNLFGNECYSNSFGESCQYINFGESSSVLNNYYSNNSFGNSCKFINLVTSGSSSSRNRVQNYKFTQGLQGNSSTQITITAKRNRGYETKVAKNSSGEIKIYCEADLIA